MSQAELARLLDLDPASVSRLLNGKRQLKAAEARKITALLDGRSPVHETVTPVDSTGQKRDSRFPFRPIPAEGLTSGERDLPVYGSVKGGLGGDAVDTGTPVEWATRPARLQGVNGAFGLYVVGASMEPALYQGDIILVHPGRPLLRGRICVVVFKDDSAIVKRFMRVTDKHVEVEQLNPPEKQQIPKAEVQGVYRVVGWEDPR